MNYLIGCIPFACDGFGALRHQASASALSPRLLGRAAGEAVVAREPTLSSREVPCCAETINMIMARRGSVNMCNVSRGETFHHDQRSRTGTQANFARTVNIFFFFKECVLLCYKWPLFVWFKDLRKKLAKKRQVSLDHAGEKNRIVKRSELSCIQLVQRHEQGASSIW